MKPIYDLYTFKAVMKNVKATMDLQKKLDNLCVDYAEVTTYEEPNLTLPNMIDDVLALLEIAFNDNGVIYSWVYDRNFGKIDGRPLGMPECLCEINTVEDLYDFLVYDLNNEELDFSY